MKHIDIFINEKLKLTKHIQPDIIETFEDFINKYQLTKAPSVNNMVVKLPDSLLKNPNFDYLIDKITNPMPDNKASKFDNNLKNFIKNDLGLKDYLPRYDANRDLYNNEFDISICTFNGYQLGKITVDLIRSRSYIAFEWKNKEAEHAIIQIIEYIINYKL